MSGPVAALSHCGECERVFVYDPNEVYRHPRWGGHAICKDCARDFGVEPIVIEQEARGEQLSGRDK